MNVSPLNTTDPLNSIGGGSATLLEVGGFNSTFVNQPASTIYNGGFSVVPIDLGADFLDVDPSLTTRVKNK